MSTEKFYCSLQTSQFFLLRPLTAAKYCNQFVCMSVTLQCIHNLSGPIISGPIIPADQSRASISCPDLVLQETRSRRTALRFDLVGVAVFVVFAKSVANFAIKRTSFADLIYR